MKPREYNLEKYYGTRTEFAESIYDNLPEMEIGVDVPRVTPQLLPGGGETKIRLSAQDRLEREGWTAKQVLEAQKGNYLGNRDGHTYEVISISKRDNQVSVRQVDDPAMEGTIFVNPRVLKAQEYNYNLINQNGRSKKIKVYDTVIKKRDLKFLEFIQSVLKAVPTIAMESFDEVQIQEQTSKAGSFRAEPSLFSKRRILNLYISSDWQFSYDETYPTKEIIETLYHELGHAIVKQIKGSVHPGKRWKACMDISANNVSEYSAKTRYKKTQNEDDPDMGEIEDIAESFRLYFGSDGAKTATTQHLRTFMHPRFEKLDEITEELAKKGTKNIISRTFSKQKSLSGK